MRARDTTRAPPYAVTANAVAVTPPDFTVTLTDRGPDVVVVVAGELDMLTTPDLVATLEGVGRDGATSWSTSPA